MTENVLSVDIGTTSLKAGIFTATGEVVSFCSVPFSAPENRFVAEAWFWALKAAVDKLKADTNQSTLAVDAIAISGNGPTVVAQTGLTIRWNEAPPAKEGEKSLFIPQIRQLKLLYDQTFDESEFIYSGPEYLINKITGYVGTILPDERFLTAYWTGEDLVENEIPEGKMPPYVELGCIFGPILPEAADFFGIVQDVPVVGVGPDFVSALIGTNTIVPGMICDRSGSSEGINLCIPAEVYKDGLRTLPSVIPGLWNISYLLPDSGNLQEEERLAKLKEGLEALKSVAVENGFPFSSKMTVTGGQAKDAEYLKRKAQALGIEIVVPPCSDAELIGDACVAFYKLGKYDSLQAAAQAISGSKA